MGGRRSPKLQRQFVHLPCLQETDLKGMWGCLRSTDSIAGEAVSLHSLLPNRNCKIYGQNFEADDFPCGVVNLYKGKSVVTTVMRICDRWMQEGTTNQRGRSHPPQCTTSRVEKGVLEIFNCCIFSYLDYRYQLMPILDNSNSATNGLNVTRPFRQQSNSYGWTRESTETVKIARQDLGSELKIIVSIPYLDVPGVVSQWVRFTQGRNAPIPAMRGLWMTDVIFYIVVQVMRATPELVLHSPNFHTRQQENFEPQTM
ncbi:hypothetical protein TNCV_1821791 [Trichonephila clavipes]|nr:hypothetical protein TNCV_1821791 [Trichonephila clavipes]